MSYSQEQGKGQTLLEEFTDNLTVHSVTFEVVDRGDVERAIADELVGDAVGVDLPIEGVDLPEGVVTDPTVQAITDSDTGITPGLMGVASYGSVVVTSTTNWDGPISLYPPKHIAVVKRSDVVADMAAALKRLAESFEGGVNDAVFVTGRSSTGDMGASVVGVHGPSEMHVVVIDE